MTDDLSIQFRHPGRQQQRLHQPLTRTVRPVQWIAVPVVDLPEYANDLIDVSLVA
ncbi:hypothetical protein GCM10027290_65740 [Micromonospora sonneratiae]|uniref:Uncharacterized protein n=1 Tax=Micromonospora sonneratiae TaxID=1184706 RepID=A0ABW3YLK7_9ACTN